MSQTSSTNTDFWSQARYYSVLVAKPGQSRQRQQELDQEIQERIRLKGEVTDGHIDHLPREIFPKSQHFYVPYFTLAASLIEIGVFLYHSISLNKNYCIETTATGPIPKCSALIYSPERRYEVSYRGIIHTQRGVLF